MLRCTCIILGLLLCSIASSQKAVSKEIQTLTSAGVEFQKADLFNFRTNDLRGQDLNLQGLRKGTIISLDKENIQALFEDANEFISIPLPVSERSQIILTLKRHEIFTPGFKLFTSSDRVNAIDYQPGLHYMGIVEGDPTSLVALSIFNDQVMAMIATDEGNFNLGKIENDKEGRHILYNDNDLQELFSFTCDTEEDVIGYTEAELQSLSNGRDLNDCVRVYIEINDDIVTAKGGAIPATDYITAIMNQSLVLYANENLTLVISEILAWTTPSPYTGEDSGANLAIYKQATHWFNGDLSHLITFDSLYGVAASISGPCSGNPDQRKCVSGINNNYENVPVFSWPVDIVTHEMGHLLGSNHTHACAWNGNGTSIDACGYDGNSPCPGPDAPIPLNGGTIMSYCTPGRGYYINFNEGFGPQPGNLIRNNVNAANNCLYLCADLPMYCLSYGIITGNKHIESVFLNTINHTSGNNLGYGNFHSLSTTLTAGNQYTITFNPGSNAGTKYWRAWIDYNDDEDWDDAGEQIVQISGSQVVTASFTVPAGLSPATTRLRVSMAYSGFVPPCGSFETGEVEDYTVVVTNNNGATCSDGIQNQGETSIDCGGPCPVCPPAPSCNDDIQNQGETGIDCGGPCPACPTCNDGIQNQNETGVDCGGVCPACPQGDSTVLLGSYFETGMDSWTDGGPDVARVSGANAWEGQYSIELADNSGAQSAMTSPVFNLSDAVGLQITFHFKAVSMETGEDFWVQYKNGSGNWITIGSFVAGTHFNNGSFYSATVTVPNFVPTSAGSLRIQCDASDNNDEIYIDAVTIVKLNGLELIESGVTIQKVERPGVILEGTLQTDEGSLLAYYPNPTNGMLTMELSSSASVNMSFQVLSLTGQILLAKKAEHGKVMQQLDVYDLPQGLYLLQILSEDHVMFVVKFVKQ